MKKLLLLLLISFSGFAQQSGMVLIPGNDTLDKKALIVEAGNLKHIVRVSDDEIVNIVGEFYHVLTHWPDPIDFELKLSQLEAVRKVYSSRANIGYIEGNVIYINAYLLQEYPNTGRAALLHLLGQWHGMKPFEFKFKYNDWSEDIYTKQRKERYTLKLIMKRLAEEHPLNYKLNKTYTF